MIKLLIIQLYFILNIRFLYCIDFKINELLCNNGICNRYEYKEYNVVQGLKNYDIIKNGKLFKRECEKVYIGDKLVECIKDNNDNSIIITNIEELNNVKGNIYLIKRKHTGRNIICNVTNCVLRIDGSKDINVEIINDNSFRIIDFDMIVNKDELVIDDTKIKRDITICNSDKCDYNLNKTRLIKHYKNICLNVYNDNGCDYLISNKKTSDNNDYILIEYDGTLKITSHDAILKMRIDMLFNNKICFDERIKLSSHDDDVLDTNVNMLFIRDNRYNKLGFDNKYDCLKNVFSICNDKDYTKIFYKNKTIITEDYGDNKIISQMSYSYDNNSYLIQKGARLIDNKIISQMSYDNSYLIKKGARLIDNEYTGKLDKILKYKKYLEIDNVIVTVSDTMKTYEIIDDKIIIINLVCLLNPECFPYTYMYKYDNDIKKAFLILIKSNNVIMVIDKKIDPKFVIKFYNDMSQKNGKLKIVKNIRYENRTFIANQVCKIKINGEITLDNGNIDCKLIKIFPIIDKINYKTISTNCDIYDSDLNNICISNDFRLPSFEDQCKLLSMMDKRIVCNTNDLRFNDCKLPNGEDKNMCFG